MLHKCFSIIFTDTFTNFGGVMSGPVASLALGKSKVIEE